MYWIILLLSANLFATTGWVLEIQSMNHYTVTQVMHEGNRGGCEYGDLNKSIVSNLLLFSWSRVYVNPIVASMINEEGQSLDQKKRHEKTIDAVRLGALLLNQHTSQGDPEALKLLHKILNIYRPDVYAIIGYTAFKEFQTETTDVNLRKIGDAETEIKSAQELREAILRLYPDLKDEIEAMLPKTWNGWFSSKFNEASGYISSMFSSSRPCNHGYKKL